MGRQGKFRDTNTDDGGKTNVGSEQKSGGEVVDFVTVSAAPSDHDEGG